MLTLGRFLKKRRIELDMSLSQIEQIIKVRAKYLRALEEDDWTIFPSKTYIIGAIDNYSKVLGLERDKMIAFFRRDYEKKEKIEFREKVSPRYLTSETKKWLSFFSLFIFLIFFIYFGFQLIVFLSPPRLTILAPKNNYFRKNSVLIKGKVAKEASVTIFNQAVSTNKEGEFEYNFPLKKGTNTLVIKVIGANGKMKVFKRVFVRKE